MLCMKRITAWLAAFLLWMTCACRFLDPQLCGKGYGDGEAYDGDGFFKFALPMRMVRKVIGAWWHEHHGSEPQKFVSIPMQGGLYTVLLGNTALKGMSVMDPTIFTQHTDAKLQVWFSDGVVGFRLARIVHLLLFLMPFQRVLPKPQDLLPSPRVQSIWICCLRMWRPKSMLLFRIHGYQPK